MAADSGVTETRHKSHHDGTGNRYGDYPNPQVGGCRVCEGERESPIKAEIGQQAYQTQQRDGSHGRHRPDENYQPCQPPHFAPEKRGVGGHLFIFHNRAKRG